MSMWFIGIIFKKMENAESVNIDLTYDIQSFTDTGRCRLVFSLLFLCSSCGIIGGSSRLCRVNSSWYTCKILYSVWSVNNLSSLTKAVVQRQANMQTENRVSIELNSSKQVRVQGQVACASAVSN